MAASILDTDLYKFTMQQAVLRHFPAVEAIYRFTHRDKNVYFTRECYEKFLEALPHFSELSLTQEERTWLTTHCPYFAQDYLDYLSSYQFKPSQVSVTFNQKSDEEPDLGRLEIEAKGPWVETILWEVPLMAVLSEIYFTTADKDWSYEGQEELAYEKARKMLEAGCVVTEFGTRRRRSYHIQDLVVKTLLKANEELKDLPGKVLGTSNVHLAQKHNTAPIGTIAHEWFMAVGALRGYEHANGLALDLWESVYPNALLLALTDTFSTEAFYKDFVLDKERAQRWAGLRQDSGDPYVYAPRAKDIYESLGIDYRQKTIIFSDALNLDKVLKLKKQADEIGFKSSFGIGTYLTNDFRKKSSGGKEKSKALNMVIKLAGVEGKHCVKISDEIMKNTGDPETVKHVKDVFNIPYTV
ncbi:nicotinate phosphoribosyltransferase [Abortiporus biennis]|nr:nicotinate phosphoribosyltransferase [Abortiporus biennis]